jgi:CubicO group peptidase (beta-lactamase class C family)
MNRCSPPLTRRAFAAGATAWMAARPARASGFEAAMARAEAFGQLHALVIADADAVRAAQAFRGGPLERPHTIKSASKSLLALLTGIAIERGALPGVQATLGELAPQLIPRGADPAVRAITVADLLTLRAGLERTSGANYGGWVASPDWVADALSRPMVDAPGGRFLYSTGSSHVLGAVLAARTGRSLHALTRDWLGGPLDIVTPPWTRDPQGRFMGGNNMAVSPLGLARIGQCLLRGGRWDGAQVVPQAWIAQSWTPRTRSPFSGHAYGYGWFLTQADGGRLAYARGYGGQMLCVAPDHGLTVAVTSDPTRPARSRGYAGALLKMVARDILPSARQAG